MTNTKDSIQNKILFWIEWLKGFRYIKFGMVGASGTVVNMLVLYLGQEYVFSAITEPGNRLYASLAAAIAIATVNNFSWNRLWTWADRIHADASQQTGRVSGRGVLLRQLGQYTLASWLGIALQYGLTLWFSNFMHYLLANVIAIVVASVSNFLANDRWTFRQRSGS